MPIEPQVCCDFFDSGLLNSFLKRAAGLKVSRVRSVRLGAGFGFFADFIEMTTFVKNA